MTKSTLSNTARTTLMAAAARDDRAALAPERLPVPAQRAVLKSLLKGGLLEEAAAEDDQPAWRMTDAGECFALRITDAGLNAIGVDAEAGLPNPPEPAPGAPTPAETASEAPQAPVPPVAAQDAPARAQRADHARLSERLPTRS